MSGPSSKFQQSTQQQQALAAEEEARRQEEEAEISGAARKLKPGEVQQVRKLRRRREEPGEEAGKVIDTSHLTDIEQQRRFTAKVTPSTQLPPASEAVSSAFQARQQASDIQNIIQEQDRVFNENARLADETLDQLEDLPSDEPAVTVQTETGTLTLTPDEYRQFVNDYKARYQEWRADASASAIELQTEATTVVGQVNDWAKNVVARNESVDEHKRDFNQAISQSIGIGKTLEEAPREPILGIRGVPPGPGAGPAPGSFGEKLQEQVQKGLDIAEAPFVALTTPVRARAETLRKEAAEEPPSTTGLGKFLAGTAIATGATAFDVATAAVRPGLAVKSAVTVGELVTRPEKRRALGEAVASDPFGFTAEVVGGAFFGAKLADIGKTLIREAGPVSRTIRAGGTPREALAVATRTTKPVDFTKLLQDEAQFRFPGEVVEPEFLEQFLGEQTFEAPETFSVQRFKDGFFTKQPLFKPRLAGQIFAPQEVVTPSTIFKFTRTPLTIPSARPALDVSVTTLTGISRAGVSLGDILSGFSITARTRQITRPSVSRQVQKPGTLTQNLQRFNQNVSIKTRNILAPPTTIPVTGIAQTQPQTQRQRVKQIQQLRIPQIQLQGISTQPSTPSPFQLPVFAPQRTTPSKTFEFDPRRKKKEKLKPLNIKKALEIRIAQLGKIKI